MTERFVDDYCPACDTDPCRCAPVEEPAAWQCAFPDRCIMPGEHMQSECHTAEDYEAYLRECAAEED